MTSIKDVATMADVSISTVSRALSGRGGVRQEKVDRIRQIAKALNYEPNVFGRGLRGSKTGNILLVFSRLMTDCLQGILEIANTSDYNILMQISDHILDDPQKIKPLTRKQVDGVIFQDVLISPKVYAAVSEAVPLVQIGDHVHYPGSDIITVDNKEMACQMARHLLDQGHTSIAYVYIKNPTEKAYRLASVREQGIRQAMAERGLTFDDRYRLEIEQVESEDHLKPWAGDDDSQPALLYGRQVADRLEKMTDKPTAIFCYNDMLAYGCLREFARRGIRVPGDYAVCGFDGLYPLAESEPILSSVVQPFYKMGLEGARTLITAIEDPSVFSGRKIILDGNLRIKKSTQSTTG